MRITFASLDALISSSSEFRAWETSGSIDAKVLDLSSVPYLCLTNLGRSGCTSFSHVRTKKFSKDGLNSSSSVIRLPRWDKLQPLIQIFRSFIGFQMNVSEVNEMGSCNLESEMLPDSVPDGLD